MSEVWYGNVFQNQPDGKACAIVNNRDAWERLIIEPVNTDML